MNKNTIPLSLEQEMLARRAGERILRAQIKSLRTGVASPVELPQEEAECLLLAARAVLGIADEEADLGPWWGPGVELSLIGEVSA